MHLARYLVHQPPLQKILNTLPAIPIAGNNLKFQFGGDTWISTLNGQNFIAGTFVSEDTDEGTVLTLKQTHVGPSGAGNVAGKIPGGGAVGGAAGGA